MYHFRVYRFTIDIYTTYSTVWPSCIVHLLWISHPIRCVYFSSVFVCSRFVWACEQLYFIMIAKHSSIQVVCSIWKFILIVAFGGNNQYEHDAMTRRHTYTDNQYDQGGKIKLFSLRRKSILLPLQFVTAQKIFVAQFSILPILFSIQFNISFSFKFHHF